MSTPRHSDETAPCRVCHHPRPLNSLSTSTSSITTTSDLEASAASCAVCSVLSRGIAAVHASHGASPSPGAISPSQSPSPSPSPPVGPSTESDSQAQRLRIDVNRGTALPSLELYLFSSRTGISLFSPTHSTPPRVLLPDLPVGRLIPATTASEDSLTWAIDRLRRCESQHTSCRITRPEDIILGADGRDAPRRDDDLCPRRLLDVGVDEDHIKLLDLTVATPRTQPGFGPDTYSYVALSHCWGPEAFLQTNTRNLATHLTTGIPLSSLPLAFREAVDFTRRLGQRHLWIDSLCIVQDDAGDWAREAARMADVYRGAYLVISASAATGAHEGLYSDAAASPLFDTHLINIKTPSSGCTDQDSRQGEEGQVAFRRSYAHMPSAMDAQLQKHPDLPTLSRGWIFQERLLARRVLHFGPHELHWECMTESACQCRDVPSSGPTNPSQHLPTETSSTHKTSQPSSKPSASIPSWSLLSPASLTKSWHALLTTYTSLGLTFPADIFPAISGIASTFQTVKSSPYLAGLWRSSLLHDLLWYPNPPSSTTHHTTVDKPWHRRPVRRAPSWSWASVSGPIAYIQTESFTPLCKVFNARVELAETRHPMGAVLSGQLTLQGSAVKATATLRQPPEDDCEKYTAWNVATLDILQRQIANVWVDWNWGLERQCPEILCFAVGVCEPSGALVLLMLSLVASTTENSPVCYQRSGLVQISKPPSRQNALEFWNQALTLEPVIVDII